MHFELFLLFEAKAKGFSSIRIEFVDSKPRIVCLSILRSIVSFQFSGFRRLDHLQALN